MRSCKRRRVNHERDDYYQTRTDFSKEEIQRSCEFLQKLRNLDDDQRIFNQCLDAMKSYKSGSITFVDLRDRVVSILRNRDGLLEEFRQLLSDSSSSSSSRESNSIKEKKPDLQRTVDFLNKLEALGDKSVHRAFFDALWFSGDNEALVEKLDVIFHDHKSLKEEFVTFLIDSRLLKPKRVLEAAAKPKPITEDTQEEYSCSSDAQRRELNGKYVSIGKYDPEKVVKKKSRPPRDVDMNEFEDKCMHQGMFLHILPSVINYGEGRGLFSTKPPVRFKDFLRWYYGEDRKVPEIFKTQPRLGVQGILSELERLQEEMKEKRETRNRRIYERVNK
ncbi:uncharacterized protein LOC18023119 [Eutrema salsugineum]|uniref:uncharacterized protein LOC18023119 n=1 Tax=Eutrema salsugineum TaxID=72664 RepID=UPI000CED19A0|nr:uncharacterized protein LOC18023119 [Eutrema salsugineum]